VQAAYSFYNVSTSTSWVDLMGDALVLARTENFDVFNALDLMDNRLWRCRVRIMVLYSVYVVSVLFLRVFFSLVSFYF
jgi:hypothetical protein